MPFDCAPGGDPRGPSCPGCARAVLQDQPSTIMHFHEDPDGRLGLSGQRWHAECARPYWDKISRVLDMLGRASPPG